jgi:hypothetical protein
MAFKQVGSTSGGALSPKEIDESQTMRMTSKTLQMKRHTPLLVALLLCFLPSIASAQYYTCHLQACELDAADAPLECITLSSDIQSDEDISGIIYLGDKLFERLLCSIAD